MSMGQYEEVVLAIVRELERAHAKFPTFPDCPFEGSAIVSEETGELAQAVLQVKYGGKRPEDVLKEAIQVSAMGMRFALNYATNNGLAFYTEQAWIPE